MSLLNLVNEVQEGEQVPEHFAAAPDHQTFPVVAREAAPQRLSPGHRRGPRVLSLSGSARSWEGQK